MACHFMRHDNSRVGLGATIPKVPIARVGKLGTISVLRLPGAVNVRNRQAAVWSRAIAYIEPRSVPSRAGFLLHASDRKQMSQFICSGAQYSMPSGLNQVAEFRSAWVWFTSRKH